MISAKALCADFRQAYDENWGYIWGEAGDVWTRANQDAATREATVEYGSRWIRTPRGGLLRTLCLGVQAARREDLDALNAGLITVRISPN